MAIENDNPRNVCFRLHSPAGRVGCYVCRVDRADFSSDEDTLIVTRTLDNRLNAAFDHIRQGETVEASVVPDDVTADTDPIGIRDFRALTMVAYDKFVGRYVDWRKAYNLFAYQIGPHGCLEVKA